MLARKWKELVIAFFCFIIFQSFFVFATAENVVIKIYSDTNPQDAWTRNTAGKFNWDKVTEATYYRYQISKSEKPGEDKWTNIKTNSVLIENLPEGENYFILEACNETKNCFGTSTYKLMIDRTGPEQVQDITFSKNNEGVLILWKPPEDVSGIKEYNIYRSVKQYINKKEFGPTDIGVKKIFGVKETNYIDTDKLTQGIAYYYRIQAIDNAGNYGVISPIKKFLNDKKNCVEKIEFSTPQTTYTGTLKFKIVSDVPVENSTLFISMQKKELEKIFENKFFNKETEAEYNIPINSYGTGTLVLFVKKPDGTECTYEKDFEFDTAKPDIKIFGTIKESGEKSAKIKVVANAYDAGLGLNKIELFANGVSKGNMEFVESEENGQNIFYSLDFSAEPKNGLIEVKAIATDMAGNSNEHSIVMKLNESTETKNQEVETKPENYSVHVSIDEEKKNYANEILLFIIVLVACLTAWALILGKKMDFRKKTEIKENKTSALNNKQEKNNISKKSYKENKKN
jgi:hypothetical protein